MKIHFGGSTCVAIEINVELKAFEDKEIVFVLGSTKKSVIENRGTAKENEENSQYEKSKENEKNLAKKDTEYEQSTIDSTKNIAYKYTIVENAKKELEETKRYWNDKLRKITVKTPQESMNIMLNGWLSYQTITSRLWAKSGFYQSGRSIWIQRPITRYNGNEIYRWKTNERANNKTCFSSIYRRRCRTLVA